MHLAIIFRNFFVTGFCHVGLGVNAYQTEKVLRRHGAHVSVFGVPEPEDILGTLQGMAAPPTHVVIEAIWVGTETLRTLLKAFPDTLFIVRSHSQVGFLQVEPPAVKILREMLDMQRSHKNLRVAANSQRLTHFLERTFGPCVFLPNLYDTEYTPPRRQHQPGILRIASFGALRLLKNHMTSAAGALLIARTEKTNLEFYVSVNRAENAGAQGILHAIRNLYNGLPWARLVESPWSDWAKFRKTIARMDLYLQPSFTETFNITVADAIIEGVPAVVSDAIDWAPDGWKVEADNVEQLAEVGLSHLHNPKSAEEGLVALRAHVHVGVRHWLKFLGV